MKKDEKNKNFQILKTLGDSVRFDIILLLTTGPKCVCEIFESLKLKQSIVSHHLSLLKENNLVKVIKNGKWSYYSLNKKEMTSLQKFIKKIVSTKKKILKC